jgi:hypothetical protein
MMGWAEDGSVTGGSTLAIFSSYKKAAKLKE